MNGELKQKIIEMFNEDDEQLEIVEDGEWKSEGKCDTREDVVKYDDKYYWICSTRSGSYYSDYDYLEPEVYQVDPREEMVKKVFWDVVH